MEQGSCDPAFFNKIKDYKSTRGTLDELFKSIIKSYVLDLYLLIDGNLIL